MEFQKRSRDSVLPEPPCEITVVRMLQVGLESISQTGRFADVQGLFGVEEDCCVFAVQAAAANLATTSFSRVRLGIIPTLHPYEKYQGCGWTGT